VIWCVLCKFVQLLSKRHDFVSQLFDVGEYRHSAPPILINSSLIGIVSQPDALTVRAIEGGLQVLYDDIGATLDL